MNSQMNLLSVDSFLWLKNFLHSDIPAAIFGTVYIITQNLVNHNTNYKMKAAVFPAFDNLFNEHDNKEITPLQYYGLGVYGGR